MQSTFHRTAKYNCQTDIWTFLHIFISIASARRHTKNKISEDEYRISLNKDSCNSMWLIFLCFCVQQQYINLKFMHLLNGLAASQLQLSPNQDISIKLFNEELKLLCLYSYAIFNVAELFPLSLSLSPSFFHMEHVFVLCWLWQVSWLYGKKNAISHQKPAIPAPRQWLHEWF